MSKKTIVTGFPRVSLVSDLDMTREAEVATGLILRIEPGLDGTYVETDRGTIIQHHEATNPDEIITPKEYDIVLREVKNYAHDMIEQIREITKKEAEESNA